MGICQYQRPDKSDVGIFKKIAIRRQAPVEDCFQETGEKDMRYDFYKDYRQAWKRCRLTVDGLGKNPGFDNRKPPKDGFDVIPMWVADMNFRKLSQRFRKSDHGQGSTSGIWIFQSGGRVL